MTAATATNLERVAAMPWWADPRFQLPAVFVGASLLAAATFTALYFGLRPPKTPPGKGGALMPIAPTRRDAGGYFFAQQGYILCPQGMGIAPTSKEIVDGTFVVLWLATPAGAFVERTWGQVVEVDPKDDNRIRVVIRGELTPTGQRALRRDQHGFDLSQVFWMTKDCIPEAYNELVDPKAVILCGANLVTFDGPDDDFVPDGLHPAVMPAVAVRDLVGTEVEFQLVSRAGRGAAFRVPVRAQIVEVGPTGDVPRVRVLEVGRDPYADDPATGHSVRAGDEFDVAWDCITGYDRG